MVTVKVLKKRIKLSCAGIVIYVAIGVTMGELQSVCKSNFDASSVKVVW